MVAAARKTVADEKRSTELPAQEESTDAPGPEAPEESTDAPGPEAPEESTDAPRPEVPGESTDAPGLEVPEESTDAPGTGVPEESMAQVPLPGGSADVSAPLMEAPESSTVALARGVRVSVKSRFLTRALQRRRKTTKFADKHSLVKRFYEEKSTPTSRTRDVVKIKVHVYGVICIFQSYFLQRRRTRPTN